MAGWASANKYALLGGLRAAAQLVSYELPIVLAVASMAMAGGSLSLLDAHRRAGRRGGCCGSCPARSSSSSPALAELQRPPFDMPVADAELVFGACTEYTGLRFAFFLLAEYAGIVVLSLLFDHACCSSAAGTARSPDTARLAVDAAQGLRRGRSSSSGCGSPTRGCARTSCSGWPGCGSCRSRSLQLLLTGVGVVVGW